MKHFARTVAFASLAVVSGTANTAQADVKIISTVAVTGRPPRMGVPQRQGSGAPRTVTAYYQGDNSRTEISGGPIVLYTGKDGKTTVLDPVRRTYFTAPGLPGGQNGPGERMGGRMTMEGRADLKPASGTQTLMGKDCRAVCACDANTAAPGGSGCVGFSANATCPVLSPKPFGGSARPGGCRYG